MKRILSSIFTIALLTVSAPASSETLTVPFSNGFVGEVGNSTNFADNVQGFADLGIDSATFTQVSPSSEFETLGAQGNDVPGTITLKIGNRDITINGALNWVAKKQGDVKLLGFVPEINSAPVSLNGYQLDEFSNYGLILNGRTFNFSTGDNVKGSADNQKRVLNGYLAEFAPQPPAGPVSVDAQTTLDTTPTVSGLVTLQIGETLTVAVNGVTYTTSSGLVVPAADGVSGVWALAIPAGDALPDGQTYGVTAAITNTDNLSLEDSTSQELTITAAAPALDVAMSVDASSLADGARNGDTLRYTVVATNTGNVPLYDLSWAQALENAASGIAQPSMGTPIVSGASASDGSLLAAGDALTFTVDYALTQADVDSGRIQSLASFQALVSDGVTASAFTMESANGGNTIAGVGRGTALATSLVRDPNLAVTQDVVHSDADADGKVTLGDTLTYTVTATNSGNVTLQGLTLAQDLKRMDDVQLPDNLGPLSFSNGSQANAFLPGGTAQATFSHLVTQADVDGAGLKSAVSASAWSDANINGSRAGDGTEDINAAVGSVLESVINAEPEMSLVMSVAPDYSGTPKVGDTLSYSYTIRNAGNVTLTGVAVVDGDVVLSGGPIGTLSPGAEDRTTFTGVYTLTQADLDAGQVRNSATVTGLDPTSTPVSDISGTAPENDTATEVSLQLAGGVTLVMSVAPDYSGPPQVGDTLSYSYAIRNAGNVTLTDVAVVDGDVVLSGGPIGTLSPGSEDSTTFEGIYTLTQVDLDAGQVRNSATVTGLDPTSTPVSDISGTAPENDTPTTFELPVEQIPAISISETMSFVDADDSGDVTVGDSLTFTIAVTNEGSARLMDLWIAPTLVRGDGETVAVAMTQIAYSSGSSQGELLVDGTGTASFVHVVTQEDLAAGDLIAAATAGAWVYSETNGHQNAAGSEDVSEALTTPIVVDIAAHGNPAIALRKTGVLNDVDGTPGTSVGDTVTYSFRIRNDGDVPLTDIKLSDDMLGGLQSQSIASLGVGEMDTSTFVIDYLITSDDIARGYVSNRATVEGSFAGSSVSDVSGPTFASDEEIVTFLGSISGQVMEANLGIPNSIVILYNEATGAEVAGTFTDSNGYYVFLELEVGTYTVKFETPEGQSLQTRSPSGTAKGEIVTGISLMQGAGMSVANVIAQVVDPSGVIYDAITRQPIAGATVTLLHNGSPVPDGWLDTTSGDSNDTVTGADGAYSFLLVSPAQSGTYALQVAAAGYSYVSDILPPQSGALTTALGAGVAPVVVSSSAPSADGGDGTYYTAFDFTFGDWSDVSTLSRGIVNNHIPMDPDGYGTNLRVTMTADASGLSTIPQVGETIGYTILVENAGDLDYSSPTLDDPLTDNEALVAVAGTTDDGVLNAGEAWTYTASYTLTPADLKQGSVENLATVQATLIAGSTSGAGAIPTGTDIGGLYSYESSPAGNTTAGVGNGRSTVTILTPDLVAMIEEDLTAILEDDLRVTMQRQSETISGYSADALDWLKMAIHARESGALARLCGPEADPLSGHVEASKRMLELQAHWREEMCSDLTRRRVIDTVEASVTHDDGLGTQHMLTYAHRRERLRQDEHVRGTFFGGYLSRTAVNDRAEGTIEGIGVNAGLYGAGRLAEETFYSYHLGGAAGRHTYDLDFDRGTTINATGDYDYFGLFAGASLAGDLRFEDTLLTPRLGVDLFYAPDTVTKVTARSNPFEQSATVSIDGARGGRFYVEGRFANDPQQANDGQGMWDGLAGEIGVTLRGFCDVFAAHDTRCGAGGSLEYAHTDVETGRTLDLRLDAEGSGSHRTLRASLGWKRPIFGGRGTSAFQVTAEAGQEPKVGYEAELRF